MNIMFHLKSPEGAQSYFLENIKDHSHFSFSDQENVLTDVTINEEGIDILRKNGTDSILLHLFKEAFIQINGEQGEFIFDAKVLDFEQRDDILSIKYLIFDEIREILIRFIGANDEQY